MEMTYEISVKADYERSWLDYQSRRSGIMYLREELVSLFPDHECSSADDFCEEDTYVSFMGWLNRIPSLDEFESVIDRMIRDNSQDIIEGLNIEVRILNTVTSEVCAVYRCRQDVWTESGRQD